MIDFLATIAAHWTANRVTKSNRRNVTSRLRRISRCRCVDDGWLFRYVAGEALVDKIVQTTPITFIQTFSALKREVGAVVVLIGAAAGAGAAGLTALYRAIPRMRGTRGCG